MNPNYRLLQGKGSTQTMVTEAAIADVIIRGLNFLTFVQAHMTHNLNSLRVL